VYGTYVPDGRRRLDGRVRAPGAGERVGERSRGLSGGARGAVGVRYDLSLSGAARSVGCSPMEAATPLRLPRVHVLMGRVIVENVVVDDPPTAAFIDRRMAAGEDAVGVVG